MPLYEYECPACEHHFEKLVNAKAIGRRVDCPQCGQQGVTRKMSLIAAPQTKAEPTIAAPAGCGRCGDPQGPCGLEP